jgi:hypothetical protein
MLYCMGLVVINILLKCFADRKYIAERRMTGVMHRTFVFPSEHSTTLFVISTHQCWLHSENIVCI